LLAYILPRQPFVVDRTRCSCSLTGGINRWYSWYITTHNCTTVAVLRWTAEAVYFNHQ